MANTAKKQQAPENPATRTYVVEETIDGATLETVTVGLAAYRNKWLKTDHLSDEEFYAHMLNPAVQAFGNFAIRVATDEDLESFKGEVEIMELVNKHTLWATEQERLRDELRTEIMEWVKENVETEQELISFLTKNNINTNQFQAIARGADYSARLSDEFLETYSRYVSAKSQGTKYARTPREVKNAFYAKLSV
ncbi:MAG: hypothetical protein ACTH4Y_07315 [Microbacterium gubbeenense]|uniref:hypothetical protein n=1 Tax=Microbacterium gubbeenense TaxID=159896 RepID=UPI003F98C9B6